MRQRILASLVVCLAIGARAAAAGDPKTEHEKTVYSLGLALAESTRDFALNESEIDFFLSGVTDALRGQPPKVALSEYRPKIDRLFKERQAAFAEREKQASAEFVAAASQQDGAETSPSGMIFRQLQVGSGASPSSADSVTVHYTGTLRDGTVFDSSRDRGEPARFPLSRVIPCWTEALQRMKVGGSASITCPATIAYGERGKGQIPPGAALRFDVELLSIE